MFIVNLAGYNQVLFEDQRKNRMAEELELFSTITHNPLFADTPIMLFLNKKDLFETMIQQVSLKKAFPHCMYINIYICVHIQRLYSSGSCVII